MSLLKCRLNAGTLGNNQTWAVPFSLVFSAKLRIILRSGCASFNWSVGQFLCFLIQNNYSQHIDAFIIFFCKCAMDNVLRRKLYASDVALDVYYCPTVQRIAIGVSVCPSLRQHISKTRLLSSPNFWCLNRGRGLVLFWRRCDVFILPVL